MMRCSGWLDLQCWHMVHFNMFHITCYEGNWICTVDFSAIFFMQGRQLLLLPVCCPVLEPEKWSVVKGKNLLPNSFRFE